MNYSITYRYTKRHAAITYVLATMTLQVARHMQAGDLVALFEHADRDIKVIGVERCSERCMA
jgi:hypothetical protein